MRYLLVVKGPACLLVVVGDLQVPKDGQVSHVGRTFWLDRWVRGDHPSKPHTLAPLPPPSDDYRSGDSNVVAAYISCQRRSRAGANGDRAIKWAARTLDLRVRRRGGPSSAPPRHATDRSPDPRRLPHRPSAAGNDPSRSGGRRPRPDGGADVQVVRS